MPNEMSSFAAYLFFLPAAAVKGTVHPRMKILSSFTHPQGVVNLYEFLSPAEHKRKYFEEFR